MIFKGLCLVVAICLAATLAVQAAEVSVQGIDVKLARDPTWKAVPDREFAQLRWATEKEKFNKNHANKLVAFGVYRTFYVTNLLRKVVQSMGIGEHETVVVNAMGSTNPTSDYDVTIDHSRADELATRFNSEFESQWGETSADVFDTNIYPVGWVLDKRAWGGRAPFCTHQLADTASSEHGANDVTVRGYEEFKPKAEFDSMRKRFEAATTIWGLVKAQYQINVLGAEMFKDHIAGVNCKKTQAPVTNRGMCMLMHYFKTTALNNINWRVVGAPVEATDAAAGSMLSTPLYMRGKQTIDAVMTQSVIKLRDLMTQPCSDPAFNRTCCNTYYASERKMYESAIKMNNMKCRNRMYEKWATIVYNKLRGAGTCNYDAWFNLVEDIRVAEFYGAETYYTEGAFFKTVLAEQALVPSLLKDNPALERFKGLKISRVEILSSLLENFADFVKELGHSVHEHWNQTETVVQASKYMKRLLTAARDIIDTSPGADSAGNVLHDELAAVLKESSKPTEELASKIRGKAMTPELIAIRDRNVAILEAVYDKLAGNYRAVINSKNPERTHIPAWYRASMALTARMLDYFILVNESNPAYHSSYVMYDGSQHNGGSSGSSKSSSSSSSSSSSTRGRPSPIGKRKPGSKPLNPGF